MGTTRRLESQVTRAGLRGEWRVDSNEARALLHLFRRQGSHIGTLRM